MEYVFVQSRLKKLLHLAKLNVFHLQCIYMFYRLIETILLQFYVAIKHLKLTCVRHVPWLFRPLVLKMGVGPVVGRSEALVGHPHDDSKIKLQRKTLFLMIRSL